MIDHINGKVSILRRIRHENETALHNRNVAGAGSFVLLFYFLSTVLCGQQIMLAQRETVRMRRLAARHPAHRKVWCRLMTVTAASTPWLNAGRTTTSMTARKGTRHQILAGSSPSRK